MKKIFIYTIIGCILFPYTNKVFSYYKDFDGSNFYTEIADKAGELDSKLYTVELNSNGGSTKKINDILGKNCLSSSLTEAEIKQISAGETGTLLKKISDSCKGEDGNISQNLFIKLSSAVFEVNNKTKVDSIKKSNMLQDISKVGVYNDGITENSPFDLIEDIELLDEIIFEKTQEYDFEGDGNVDLMDKIENKIDRSIKEIKNKENSVFLNTDYTLCKLNGNCDTQDELDRFLCEELGDCGNNSDFIDISDLLGNKNTCRINKSGLTRVTSSIIQNDIGNNLDNSNKENNETNNDINSENTIIEPKSDYKKLNDNKVFPCNNFFCIKVSFDTYNHNLFGGWENKYPSIEYLIKRSNRHLKKFANASLVQSKMTLNNFELGLKDIDLSEMLHMSVHTTSKPVPILDLNKDFEKKEDKDGGEDEAIYSFQNQLKEYYKSYGLDYKRQNDLSLFTKIEADRLAAENSGYLKATNMANLLDAYYSEKSKKSEKINEFEKNIQEKVRTGIISDFETQFKEVEVFSKSLNDYVSNLDTVLDNMLEIPIDKGVN